MTEAQKAVGKSLIISVRGPKTGDILENSTLSLTTQLIIDST